MKSRDELERLNEKASIQNEVKFLGLKDRPGKQNFPEDMRKMFELVTDIVKEASREVTKTLMVTSQKSSNIITNLNGKLSNNMSAGVLLHHIL